MYLKLNNKKIEVYELTTFWERFKGLKFNLQKLDYILKYPNKFGFSTIFICQNIDIIETDKNDKVLYIHKNIKPEKYIFPKLKVKNIYLFPKDYSDYIKINDILKIK